MPAFSHSGAILRSTAKISRLASRYRRKIAFWCWRSNALPGFRFSPNVSTCGCISKQTHPFDSMSRQTKWEWRYTFLTKWIDGHFLSASPVCSPAKSPAENRKRHRQSTSVLSSLNSATHTHTHHSNAAALTPIHSHAVLGTRIYTHIPHCVRTSLDAKLPSHVVHSEQSTPLLHRDRLICWDLEAALLDLRIEAVQIQVYDHSARTCEAASCCWCRSSPSPAHFICRGVGSFVPSLLQLPLWFW